MESWPTPTDCERLRAAFDVLEKQGIVALEDAGFTQHDGCVRAADLAAARHELGADAVHGYCFFSWQDTADAAAGNGLLLAYGSLAEEPAEPEPAKPAEPPPWPAVCPTCHGRGWVAASDPSQFPTTCFACHNGPPPVTPEPAPSLAQKVGAAVVEACRHAGLEVDWTGKSNQRVSLPAFRWQRRLTVTKESDVQDFLEGWELEMRAGYRSADEILTTLDARAADWFESFSDYGPSLRARLRSHTERFLEKERLGEATWSEATVNDRITSAFEELNRRGVLAREDVGLTIQDGWGYAGLGAEPMHRGVIFFHQEDVIDGVEGRGLLLAFGALGAEPSEDEAASAALAQEVVGVLRTNGISCSWSHSVTERIRIAPFEWRRRRWTKAPSYPLVEAAPEVPKRPSFFARLFGAASVTGADRSKEHPSVPARQCGIVVRAVRDGGGVDLRRTRQFREAWKTLGNRGDAHAGHPGVPHIFIRAGSYFSLAPQLATANLRDEKNEIFLRGARAKAAKSKVT